jgi:hypothetical protein
MDPRTQKLCAIAVQAEIPLLITGDPGSGKSSIFRMMADELDWNYYTFVPSRHQASDLSGLPLQVGEVVKWSSLDWALRLMDNGKHGLLVLDEANTGSKSMEAALMQVMLDGIVGSVKLQNVSRVMIINPPEIAPDGQELSAPMSNRVMHVDWKVDVKTWIAGMIGGWSVTCPVLPDTWRSRVPYYKAQVASYIERNATSLQTLPKDEQGRAEPFATCRVWEMVATAMAVAETGNEKAESDITARMIGGLVGSGEALAFLRWMSELSLPSPSDMIADPDGFRLPKRGDQINAALSSLAAFAISESLDQATWDAVWKVLARVGKSGNRDQATVSAIAMIKAGYGKFTMPKEASDFVNILKHSVLKA